MAQNLGSFAAALKNVRISKLKSTRRKTPRRSGRKKT